MFDGWLYLALVIALMIGFFLGRRHSKNKQYTSVDPITGHYFKGLNFLLNEQPDAAIDTFIQALEVNSETLETHLALGKLLRKRGEVDRAIRIHQNLLARPGLTVHQTHQAQYELATDFVKSGLFDRAEGLLEELVVKEGPYKVSGLKRLLEVYRDEKEWEKGLSILQKLSGSRLSRSYDDWAPIRAHFCCELAEVDIIDQDYLGARQWLRQALSFHRQSVMANLLLGRLEIAVGHFSKGVAQLEKVISQNPDYISEVLPYLSEAYQRLGNFQEYYRFLTTLNHNHQDASILLELSELIARIDSELAAAEYVAKEVVKHPSGVGLHKLLDYYLSFTDGKTKEYLLSLRSVMEKVIDNNMYHQCRHCGFKGRQLHWLCPSCKSWGSLKPKKAVADEY